MSDEQNKAYKLAYNTILKALDKQIAISLKSKHYSGFDFDSTLRATAIDELINQKNTSCLDERAIFSLALTFGHAVQGHLDHYREQCVIINR